MSIWTRISEDGFQLVESMTGIFKAQQHVDNKVAGEYKYNLNRTVLQIVIYADGNTLSTVYCCLPQNLNLSRSDPLLSYIIGASLPNTDVGI